MYCKNCGKELSVNTKFCQHCGANIEIIKEETVQPLLITNESENNLSKNETKQNKEEISSKKNFPIISDIITFIIIAILLFYFNCNLWPVILLLGIEILKFFLAKKKKITTKKVADVFSLILVVISIFYIYNGYQDKKAIDTVKQQTYMDVSYDVLFHEFSNDLVWSCNERGRFTTIDLEDSNGSGSYNAIVSVSGGCYIDEQEATYTLEFNVSTTYDKAYPKNLIISGVDYYSSTEIDRFLHGVYEYYLSHSKLPIDVEKPLTNNSVSIDNCELVDNSIYGYCLDVTYTFTNTSGSSDCFLYLYDSYVYQNGIECKEEYNYTTEESRNIANGAQYTFTERYILQNINDDITIEVVAPIINPRDTTDLSVTYSINELLDVDNKESQKSDIDFNDEALDNVNDNNIYTDESEPIIDSEKYCGIYTAEDGSTISIILSGDRCKVDISIAQLALLDDGECIYSSEQSLDFIVKDPTDKDLYGSLNWSDDYSELKLTITNSTWRYLNNGDEFTFHKGVDADEIDLNWFINDNDFYNKDKTLQMHIVSMNDVMLYIEIGNNNASESWAVEADPKLIKDNGGIVYTNDSGQTTLTYYPDGNYVEFENNEGLLSGKYYGD